METPANAIVFATGNNLKFSGDVIRRSLMCSMDAGVEQPELRDFKTDVLEDAWARRGELVAAGLTVLRAWRVADERLTLPAFGGFEDWSYRVREALVWLGRTDPCETQIKVRESDRSRDEPNRHGGAVEAAPCHGPGLHHSAGHKPSHHRFGLPQRPHGGRVISLGR